jgi:hypothetical protein
MTDKHINHYGEAQLELFLLALESLDPGLRKEIADHVAACDACSAIHADLAAMHGIIGEAASGAPTDDDRIAADRLARRGGGLLPSRGLRKVPDEALEGYAEVLEPTGRAIVRRIVRYVQVYPVRSAATFSIAAALAVLGVLNLRPTPDTNPVYAKFSGNVLRVFNREGDTLWTRMAPAMPDRGSEDGIGDSLKRVLLVDDIDGDGANEVLISGEQPCQTFSPETLYCFDGRANLKWKSGCGPIIRLGDNAYLQFARWRVLSFFVMHLPGERQGRLFYLAQAVPYMTSKVGELTPADGREVQTYWHTGGIALDARCDITGDRAPEIVLGAINNAFRCASVIVLDPRDISGYGTTTPEYVPRGIGPARELYYVTLKPTDVSEVTASHLYNAVSRLNVVNDSVVQVHANETMNTELQGGIIYTFGRSMELLSVYPTDPFIKTRERYLREGKLTGAIDRTYLDGLRNGVRYLVRDGRSAAGPL